MASLFDFSKEQDEQTVERKNYGPVPSGSKVVVKMTVLEGNGKSRISPLIRVANSGLNQIYVEFEVVKGTYSGVKFRQYLTLPVGLQPQTKADGQLWSNGQVTSMKIGGAQIKTMLAMARRNPVIEDLNQLDGLRFPIVVGINDTPREKNGRRYWNNTMHTVVSANDPDLAVIQSEGELINEGGAVSGDSMPDQRADVRYESSPNPFDDVPPCGSNPADFDDCPF